MALWPGTFLHRPLVLVTHKGLSWRFLSHSTAHAQDKPPLLAEDPGDMSGKKRQSANSNMRWYTRVVSGLTSDTEPCVSVHFDTAQYLFNCGEGTTRAFIQQKYGIKKSKAIFLTQVKSSRSGGLTGKFYLWLLRPNELSLIHCHHIRNAYELGRQWGQPCECTWPSGSKSLPCIH